MIHADVVREPIDTAEVLARVGGAEDGAVVLFVGTVRDHAEGRRVDGVSYDAYEAMARDVLRRRRRGSHRPAGRRSGSPSSTGSARWTSAR